ncbi:hypothetical protein N9K65_03085 [Candidatus Poseidoniales archaeon]|jgi:hypothetical protein|nr:hypothetical protein [Candidatus Poseidoniales archaeon]
MNEPHPLVALCLGFFTGLSPRLLVELSVTFANIDRPTKSDLQSRHIELTEDEVDKVLSSFEKIQFYLERFDDQWGKVVRDSGQQVVVIDAYVHHCAFCKHSELVHIGNAAEIEQRLSMYGCRVCGLITPGPYGEETIQFDRNNSKGGDDDN